MKYFFYMNVADFDGEYSVIKIKARTRPSKKGTYKIVEYRQSDSWFYGPWIEVSYDSLKEMTYIGSTKT